ncbi:hypothetical protein [Undibacterium sp. Ren11W]|uniref:hypothetical protein n=1 Tax=Undibacterium sp. Ren11W TaxID=3413045 RepID=UPI003BF44879
MEYAQWRCPFLKSDTAQYACADSRPAQSRWMAGKIKVNFAKFIDKMKMSLCAPFYRLFSFGFELAAIRARLNMVFRRNTTFD